jgi:sRNA-binding protein
VDDTLACVQLERLKAERDQQRAEEQAAALQRQLARWQSPRQLRSAQQVRPDPQARRFAYARHALVEELTAASRAAQVKVCDALKHPRVG